MSDEKQTTEQATPEVSRKEQVRKAHEEMNLWPLGTEEIPYPMMARVPEIKNGSPTGRSGYELGVVQSDSNPMEIPSWVEYPKSVGRAFRDMPTPSMLPLLKEALEQRQSSRRVQFFMGEAGAGKTYLAGMVAKMRDPRGAMVISCGGRDLSELLYETVLDYDGGRTVYDELDKRISEDSLNPLSLKYLEDALGDAFTRDESGKVSVDWKKAAEFKKFDNEDEVAEGTKKDADATRGEAASFRTNVLDAINKVVDLENLRKEKVDISFKTVEGPLIRAYKEGREIILDEYNKGKPGTDDALQTVWQVINGEIESDTVGAAGMSFTFSRDEMHPGFFATLTGNRPKDGRSTSTLSESAYQRLSPVFIEDPTAADLQHRICQKLTGVPISTIYNAASEHWDNVGEQEFTRFLTDVLKAGKSTEEQANIPSWQFEMLQNWPQVLQASEQLATFYHTWMETMDPDSDLYRDAEKTGSKNSKALTVLEDLDEELRRSTSVGQRRMMKHLDKAVEQTAEAIRAHESSGFAVGASLNEPPSLGHVEKDPIEKEFGTRLVNTILDDVNAITHGREKLNDWLLIQAGHAGMFNVALGEGASSGDRLIEDLLNIDPDKKRNLPENIKEIQGLLCDYIRDAYSEEFAAREAESGEQTSDNNIVNPSNLETILAQIAEQKELGRDIARSGRLVVPNLDTDNLVEEPLTNVVGVDRFLIKPTSSPEEEAEATKRLTEEEKELRLKLREEHEGLEKLVDIPTEDLLDVNRLLVSLAIPDVGQKNLKSLWNDYALSFRQPKENDYTGYLIGHNQDPSGIAVNLLVGKVATGEVGDDGQPAYRDEFLHVIMDTKSGKDKPQVLVTGSAPLKPALLEALESNGVTYVQRPSKETVQGDNGTETVQANPEELAEASAKAKAVLDEMFSRKSGELDIEMPLERYVANAIGMRLPFETDIFDENGRAIGEKKLYDVPHPQNFGTQGAVDMDERHTDVENILSILMDEHNCIKNASSNKNPYFLTESPSIEQLKHTIRAQQGNDGQQAGASL